MIPRIGRGGVSAKGAYQYQGHDKGKTSTHRVGHTHTQNMVTDDLSKAWKVMAYTIKSQDRLKEASGQKATGRKLEKPIFNFSLAWHPEQKPSWKHMLETAQKAVKELGLEEHEAWFVEHLDRPQRHIHITVNRVHPITGLAADLGNSKRKLSDFAQTYERQHGKVYCQQREKNSQKRKQGEKTHYADPNIADAWSESKNGRGFMEALARRGYQLAQGRRRLVIVDAYGQIVNPVRHLAGVKSRAFREKLADVKFTHLPDADALKRQIQQQRRETYDKQQEFLIVTPAMINRLQDRQLEERAKTFNGYRDRMERTRDKLAEHYKIQESKREIAALAAQIMKPSLWTKFSGKLTEQQNELERLKGILESGKERIREKIDDIEKQSERAMNELAERHAREKELLFERGPKVLEFDREREKRRNRERGWDFER